MSFFDKLRSSRVFMNKPLIIGKIDNQEETIQRVERSYKRKNKSEHKDSNVNQIPNPLTIGGKTIDVWEMEWKSVGILCDLNLTRYNRSVGVYRAWLDNKIVYIGRATGWSNGGFKECLSCYIMDNNIARSCVSWKLMHEYKNQLHIDIITTGSDEEDVKVATQLEAGLTEKYRPVWNVKINI